MKTWLHNLWEGFLLILGALVLVMIGRGLFGVIEGGNDGVMIVSGIPVPFIIIPGLAWAAAFVVLLMGLSSIVVAIVRRMKGNKRYYNMR